MEPGDADPNRIARDTGGRPGHGTPLISTRSGTTVVVVTYNSAEVLADCLRAFPDAFAGAGDYHVIVADNASTDGSVALARAEVPGSRVVQLGRNAGYAAGINAAIAVAPPGQDILVLNPDVRLRPGSVAALIRALETPPTGIAVPRILGPRGRVERSLRRDPTLLRAFGEAVLGGNRAGRWPALGETVVDSGAYEHPGVVDWASGAVMLVSRQCLDECAADPSGPGTPWDESFFLYSEETEFALRARRAGWVVRYTPEAEAVHLGGESETSPYLWALLTRNKVRLYRRERGALAGTVYWATNVLNQLLRSVRGSATHRAALRSLIGRSTGEPAPPAGDERPGWVCFSAQDWWYHNRAHSDFQLMTRIAGTRPVLFVNSITMRLPLPGRSTRFTRRLVRKAQSMARACREPVPGLPDFHVLTPVILPFYGSRVGRALNASLIRRQVSHHMKQLGMDRPVVMVTIPTAWDVVSRLPYRCLIFNRSDKHSAFGEARSGLIQDLERRLLTRADRVVYVSGGLMQEEAAHTDGRAVFLDHGVDLDHFRRRAPGDEPDDLRPVPRPRIGFFGGLDDYVVDFTLLERLAVEIPEASLVLVGDATCSMRRFEAHANVHWLGFRPYEDIPAYGSGFDVAIMPWLDNEWIANCNPIKLKEYLALELPVVTTGFAEAGRYASVLGIADDHDDFVARVRAALEGDSPAAREARRAAVAGDSWSRRAAELRALAEGVAGRPA